MSEPSHLSRYRPAVLAITGVAAAYGAYLLYTTYSERPAKSALHRSNAVHRARSERQPPQRPTISSAKAWEDLPLGRIILQRGIEQLDVNLAQMGMPSADLIRHCFPGITVDEDFQHELNVAAIECVIRACSLARSPEHLQRLANLGFERLPWPSLEVSDVERLELTQSIRNVLPNVTSDEIAIAFYNCSNSDRSLWGNRSTSESSNNDETTFAETDEGPDSSMTEPSQGIKGLLFHIAESDAKRKAYEHRGIHCEECGERPIRGVRWHCLNCPDFDLCSTCEANTDHQKTHVFAKIKIPLPVLSQPTKEYPLWYPGDPRKLHSPLNSALKKRLQEEYTFDAPHMDANYDQFTSIANVPWPSDPNGVKAAIDRRTFNKALTSERWPQRFRPNAVYDRMFAFYDTNNDGFIGFEEFVSGLAYLRGPRRFASLHRALQGFDIDGDGYVDRKDFLRLFRAKYEIQKLLIGSMIEGHEHEQTQAAMETIRSSQPISSVFALEEIPPGEDRPRAGKTVDAYGDLQPLPGTKTVLGDDEGWSDERAGHRPTSFRNGASAPPHERLAHLASRFEEMLESPTDEANGATEEEGGHESDAPQRVRRVIMESSLANGATSHEEAQATDEKESEDADSPLDQDILWQIVEDGFHEMLNPLFKTQEDLDENVISTRKTRERWRKEIDVVVQEKEDFQEELKSAAEVDPLMATAMNSYSKFDLRQQHRGDETSRSDFVGGLVPTDTPSLARREAEIAQRPLEELLDATGYTVVDASDNGQNNGSPGNEAMFVELSPYFDQTHSVTTEELPRSFASDNQPRASTALSSPVVDPTMPQNRPMVVQTTPEPLHRNGAKATSTQSDNTDSPESNEADTEAMPPSKEHLELFVSWDELDREIRARGGPGRLSYDEIEEMVKAETSKELRGLVTSWLEWASF